MVAMVSMEKEKETGELARALRLLKVNADAVEADLKGQLEHKEMQRRAETSALTARVRHMRELQQQALSVAKGEARKMLFVAENVAALSSMDPDVRRRMGMDPKVASTPGVAIGDQEDPSTGFDVDAAHAASKFHAAILGLKAGRKPGEK